MNKLLQHIIDAGDVDHKILPTYQMRGEVRYDNIPSPASMRNKAELDFQFRKMQAAKTQAAQNAQRYGVIRQAEPPQSMASKAWSIATNPMTALAYKVQGRDIPDYLERGPKNSLDIAVNMVNPFAIAEAVRSIPGNVARGEFVDAGLNALNIIPAAKVASKALKTAAPNVSKAVQAFGPNNSNKGFINFMTTREGVKFYPEAVARDYKRGISEGLLEAIPNALGSTLRKTGIYPKARTIGRPFSEVFPRGAKKAEAIAAQDEAFDRAMDFVNEYYYPGGSQELRPALADKIRSIYPNATGSAENFNRLSNGNPFDLTNNRLATSTTWGAGREGLDISDINYINRKRGSIGGYNDVDNLSGGNSITLRNYGPYYKTPYDVAKTVVHEAGHTAQKLGYMPNFKNPSIVKTPLTWGDEIAKYDDELEYFTSNPETGLGRLYGKSMIVPDRSKPYKTSGAWESSPNELHSELMSEKYVDYLKSFDPKNPNAGLQNKTLNTKVIDELANPSDETLKRILDRGNLDKHFRPEATAEEKLKLLRLLPAVVPAIGAGALGAREQKYGGENNMFRVFAQEGLEYKGPSIVDYLATKGYSGTKAFRKGLAEKYGIEGYNFSAAKNTELLNKLRENDDLLEQNYQPTQAPISVERIMEMENQARAARQAAASPPAQRPINPGNYYTFSPEYGDMRIAPPKINVSLQPKVKYDKFSLKPQMVIPLPFGFGKRNTTSQITPEVTPEVTRPVTGATPKSTLTLPEYNPFVAATRKPILGPLTSEVYNTEEEVSPMNQESGFGVKNLMGQNNMFTNPNFYSFYRPANKPAVKTEKVTAEVEKPWYEEFIDNTSNFFSNLYDSYSEAVNKSGLDFSNMSFGPSGMSPQGANEITRDVTKKAIGLFSPDMAQKYENWLDRQQAIKNMANDPKSRIIVPKYDFAPMYVTGDTIPDAGGRQYHIPESMDIDALRFGVRNRGDFTPIDSEAASITAFHPFENAKTYFASAKDDPANATYLAYSPDGKIQVGQRKDFENKDVQVSRVFSNRVVDFIREPSGSIKKVPAGAKVNKNAFSPAVTVLDDQGKQVQGKLNLVVPQGNKADEAFGIATGGRFIFKTPDGQTRLVSGSLKNIEEEFKRIKGKNPYVTVVSLDNGSYSRGLRTKDQKFTAADLRAYDNLNTGGGNFAYLLPGQQTSRPLAKFAEFEQEATKKLQSLYPGKKVSVGYQNTGLYDKTGGRDIQSQLEIQKKGNSQTPVSLHNFDAAKDYVLYVDGKPIDANVNKKLYKDVLWSAADKTGMYHLEDWDVAHIGLAKEGQKTAFDELKAKYPEIFTNPNFIKSLEYINKNKSNPTYAEYYELLNNIQPFTGQPRITEFEKQKGSVKKAYGGPILDPRGQWAHPGKVTRIPGSDITMQGVNYPVLGIGNNGKKQVMYPGQDYTFGGASYVDEYPMMQSGGWSGGGLSRSNLAMMSALTKDIKNQKARDSQATISQYTPKPGDQERMNANKDAYRKEQGKFLNRLADNQYMQAAGRNLPGAAEFALDVMTAGEAATALKAVKPLLKAGAKYLTEKTPLRNAYKFNPSALTDDVLFNQKGVVNRQLFGDDAFESFKQYGPTTRPGVPETDQFMQYIKAPSSNIVSSTGEEFTVKKTMDNGSYTLPYFQEGELWYTGKQRNNLANQLGKERIITAPKSDIWFAPAGESTVMGGDDLSKGLIDSYSKGRRVLIPGSEYANPSNYSVFEPHWWKGYKQVPVKQNGGLLSRTVSCSNCGWSWKAADGGSDPMTCHKCGGTVKMKNGGQHGGLDRWFAEKWVDVKTGKDCGRQEGESRAGYPACRPSKRVNSQTPKTSSEMSSAEKAKFKASKTSSQRIDYNHKRNK
jgi:hypothetical protein